MGGGGLVALEWLSGLYSCWCVLNGDVMRKPGVAVNSGLFGCGGELVWDCMGGGFGRGD
jgi:hypothetical protein